MTSGLLVAGGGFQALPMLRALRRVRARVIVADCYEQNPNRYAADVYAVVPCVDSGAQFEHAILSLCDQHDVKIVFATTDHDALAVATLGPKLRARGIIAAVADAALLRAWADKVVCLRDAAAAGLPVLPIVEPEQGGCTYPLIGKPRHGWGGRGHVIVRSTAEPGAASTSDPDHSLFWQPLFDSYDEWSVDFAVRESGEVSPLVARQRLRTSGGFAVVSRVQRDTPVAALASRAAQVIAERGGCGPMNLQILVDPRGSQWLNDVNLRPGTSATAALAAGVDFAAFMLNEPARFAEPSDFLHVRTLCDTTIPMPFEGPVEAVAFDLDDCLIDQKDWMDPEALARAGRNDWRSAERDRSSSVRTRGAPCDRRRTVGSHNRHRAGEGQPRCRPASTSHRRVADRSSRSSVVLQRCSCRVALLTTGGPEARSRHRQSAGGPTTEARAISGRHACGHRRPDRRGRATQAGGSWLSAGRGPSWRSSAPDDCCRRQPVA